VTWQTRAIFHPLKYFRNWKKSEYSENLFEFQ
jgi:hypothetical protein